MQELRGELGLPRLLWKAQTARGGTLEGPWRRRQGLSFLHCPPRLHGKSGIRDRRRGLSAARWQSRGNTSQALQFAGLWENTPGKPTSQSQVWVRVGWPKSPCEGQTEPKLTRGRCATAHITYWFHCSSHVLESQHPPWLEHYQPCLWSFTGAGHSILEMQKPMRGLSTTAQGAEDITVMGCEQWAALAFPSSDSHPGSPALQNGIISTYTPWQPREQGHQSLLRQVLPPWPFAGPVLSSPLICHSGQIPNEADFIHTATSVPCTQGRRNP